MESNDWMDHYANLYIGLHKEACIKQALIVARGAADAAAAAAITSSNLPATPTR